MRLDELDAHQRHELNRRFRDDRLVILEDVELPTTFEPSVSEVAFVEDDGNCDVFIDACVDYRGDDDHWREICARPTLHEESRFVLSVEGEAEEGLQALQQLLDRAEEVDGAHPGEPNPRVVDESDIPPEREDEHTHSADGPLDGELRNLVQQPREQSLVGREAELERLQTHLLRESKPGVLLCGPPGVGKTALVEMLAQSIADGEAPEPLCDTPVYELPLGRIVEQMRAIGDLEREARRLFDQPGRPMFFLDEIHQIGRDELEPLADVLKPAMAEGEVRIIGATTPVEWREIDDPAFERRLAVLQIEEPDLPLAFEMTESRRCDLSEHHGLEISEDQVREAVALSARYLQDQQLPDKSVDVLDRAAAMQLARQDGEDNESNDTLTRANLYRATAAASGLDEAFLNPRACDALVDETFKRLRREIIGQSDTLDRLESTIRARMSSRFIGWDRAVETLEPNWSTSPVASLLCCGPTGVGKTETAKILADELFDGRLIRLNGSDVGPEARHGTAMWVGAPPGYVGWQRGGTLTNGLRHQGPSVILVDELEKAGADAIQNILLPLLGDGVVTDRNTGDELHATDCIVVCTSNIDLDSSHEQRPGYRRETLDSPDRSDIHDALTDHLRPEIIGRFDAIGRYEALDREAKWRIWLRKCRELESKIGPSTEIQFDEEAQQYLEAQFETAQTGARALEELFDREMIPMGSELEVGQALEVTCEGERLTPSNASHE